MIFLFSVYFTIWLVFAVIIDYATKYYLRPTMSWEKQDPEKLISCNNWL